MSTKIHEALDKCEELPQGVLMALSFSGVALLFRVRDLHLVSLLLLILHSSSSPSVDKLVRKYSKYTN